MNDRGFFATIGIMWLVGLALTVAFYGSLIYFVFWCAQHFGLI